MNTIIYFWKNTKGHENICEYYWSPAYPKNDNNTHQNFNDLKHFKI